MFSLYTAESGLYKHSNEALRTRTDLAFWRPFIYHVMRGMDSVARPEPRRVYRGVSLPLDQGFYAKYRPGSIVPLEGLTSTSTAFEVAQSFTAGKPTRVLWAIKIHNYKVA